MPVFKKPITKQTRSRFYTELSVQFMEETVRSYIRSQAKGLNYAEDGLPVLPPEQTRGLDAEQIQSLRERLTPKEVQALLANRQKALEYAVKDRLVMQAKPDPEVLDRWVRIGKPDYVPLTGAERKQREKFSDEFRIKFAEYSAKREIVNKLTTIKAVNQRSTRCLLKVGISDEDLAWNKQLADDLSSGNPVVKKAAYARALIRAADDTNLAGLDLTNDTYIKDNLESLYSLIYTGPELEKLIGDYRSLGGKPDPEVEQRIDKLYAMVDAAGILRSKLDVIGTPVYGMIRTEELYGHPNFMQIGVVDSNNPDNTVDPTEFLYEDEEEPDDYFCANLKQIGNANGLAAQGPFFDKAKTPQERLETFYEQHRVREKVARDNAAQKAEEKRLREKPARDADIARYVKLDSIPKELTPELREKRIDYEIQLRKNIERLNNAITANNEKYNKEFAAKEKPVSEKFVADTAKAKAELTGKELEDRLGKLTAEKDAAISRLTRERDAKLVNRLKLTEDQIQSYLTPERMALLKRAEEVSWSQNERLAITDRIKDKPANLSRIVFAHLKNPDEAGADAHNRHVKDFLSGSDYNAQLDRKKMMLGEVDTILSLDADKLSFKNSFTKLADYALDNMDACLIGFESEHVFSTMKDELGFSEDKDLRKYMSDVVERGTVLGGRAQDITKLLLDDSYMKLPFEALDSPQLQLLINEVRANPKAYGLNKSEQVDRLTNYQILRHTMDHPEDFTYTEPSKDTRMTLSSFEDRLPDTDALRRRLDEFENRLNETDHWYNYGSSSKEYRQMRDAVQQLKTEFDALTTPDGSAERFQAAKATLITAAKGYIRHVGKEPKNDNQRLRSDTANELKDFVSTELPGKTVSAIIKNNAIARPEDKARYDTIINQTRPAAAVKVLNNMLEMAKKELSDELQKPTPDKNTLKCMAATVITCRMYKKELGDAPQANNGNAGTGFADMKPNDAKVRLGREVISLMNSEAFENAVSKLDNEKLRELIMSEDAAKTDIMRDIYDGLSKQHKAPEATGRSLEKSHSRQSDAPQKKGKALGK